MELSRSRRFGVLAICCMSLFIVGMDNTIVNVALPDIAHDLHASTSGLQWTVDAYLLVLASLLMLSGSTADRLGRRRTFQLGLVLFSLGSLLCSLAPNAGMLVVFRMMQAVGGSMLNPVAMSIITNTFTDRKERASAIGVWGGVVGLSMAFGPVIGGLLVSTIGWRSIFWVNVPIGVAAIVLTALFVPESKAAHARRLDPIGQLLVIVLLATLVYGIIEGPGAGWTSGVIIGCFVVAVCAGLVLVGYERRRTEPLLDPAFFRSLPFSGAVLIAISGCSTLGGFLFLNSLYLQGSRGFSALDAGLLTLPMALMTAVFSPIAGRIVGVRGPRFPLLVAGAAITVTGLLLTEIDTQTPIGYLIVAYLFFGIGVGMLNSPITNAAVAGMPNSQAGVAAAIASTSRQVGSALGVAVLGSIVTAGTSGAHPSGFAAASVPAWWIVAGCGAVVMALGWATTGRKARASAEAVLQRQLVST